ncbi:N-acetylmuramoyl-L-alanine amidase [Kitasatospora phosalacinea]|uniref:N-acetylmuramoyl-L-alanine amidase n=1 Tax=Kitasatospora phosalacinea TaxID=2065 RepID=UPI001FD86D15|nr:peptidoglycan recognition family protein [Kitasatospora phosalacinea]
MPRAAAAAAATALVAAVLGAAPATATGRPPADGRLQRQFTDAAAEFGVPAGLLLALSYQQTRWESHGGAPSTTGNHGVTGLTRVDPAAVPSGADRPRLHTLDTAAALIGRPAEQVATDPAQNLRAAAALLARYQREAGRAASADPGDWYRTVARFGGDDERNPFADRVFATLRTGAERTTADGQHVRLAAAPVPHPDRPARPAPRSADADDADADCPADLDCDFRPAAYALTDPGDPTSYGNYTKANRPDDGQRIQYVVLHDTEGGYDGSLATFGNPKSQASAHYLVRSSDGHVTQLVSNRDVAWHAGNKTFNMHSIGIEHEGYAFPKDRPTWYSEQLYQSSAALVRHLAARYGIPLDREHVLGHDDVPGPVQANAAGMHWDPGTFWDWAHYLDLLGVPLPGPAGPPAVGSTVVISPAFDTNRPAVNGTSDRPENFVYLRTGPSPDAPLLNDGTLDAADWRDKAVTGARYVVADVSGDWTAIWYDGRKAWFANPGGTAAAPDARPGRTVLTPGPGSASIPVYGRAYPEAAAYRGHPSIPVQQVVPLSATVPAGQAYPAADAEPVRGDFYYARNIDGDAPEDRTLVVGCDTYYPIRYNHRLAYLRSTDVRGGSAPPACPGH